MPTMRTPSGTWWRMASVEAASEQPRSWQLLPGGALVLSEKLAFEDPREQELLGELHHEFKAQQGYSALERPETEGEAR